MGEKWLCNYVSVAPYIVNLTGKTTGVMSGSNCPGKEDNETTTRSRRVTNHVHLTYGAMDLKVTRPQTLKEIGYNLVTG